MKTLSVEQQALKAILNKLGRLENRLLGRRPHPNDISWAKDIVFDIRKLATDAYEGNLTP